MYRFFKIKYAVPITFILSDGRKDDGRTYHHHLPLLTSYYLAVTRGFFFTGWRGFKVFPRLYCGKYDEYYESRKTMTTSTFWRKPFSEKMENDLSQCVTEKTLEKHVCRTNNRTYIYHSWPTTTRNFWTTR